MTMTRADKWRGPIRQIQDLVCEEFGVSRIELISHRRNPKIIPIRFIAYWICRMFTAASYPAIAKQFEDRDHATIISGFHQADKHLSEDTAMKIRVDVIVQKFIKVQEQK